MKLTILFVIGAVIITIGDVTARDSCSNSHCRNGGTCINLFWRLYRCSCPNGYEGLFCQISVCPPDDTASVYHKYVHFNDAYCGVPDSSLTGERGKINMGRKKRRVNVFVSTWSWAHSYVEFRGQCFEWGDSDWSYQNGGIGRDDSSCPDRDRLVWNKGSSCCTREQAEQLGDWYISNNVYILPANNCHSYAQWLMNRLLNNECAIPVPVAF